MIPKNRQDMDTCWLCGAHKPLSHALIVDDKGTGVGRVCGSHTLAEVILDRGDGDHRIFSELRLIKDPWD